jgi:hypothetical protein
VGEGAQTAVFGLWISESTLSAHQEQIFGTSGTSDSAHQEQIFGTSGTRRSGKSLQYLENSV